MTAPTIVDLSEPIDIRETAEVRVRRLGVEIYRELIVANRQLGHHDLVVHCERELSALLYGGRVIEWETPA